MGKELKPLNSGDTFGRLTVLCKDEELTKIKKRVFYICKCSCGSPPFSIWKASLLDKRHPTQSCGCIVKEKLGYIDDREKALIKLLYKKTKDRHIKQLGFTEDSFISFESFVKKIKLPCYYCGTKNSSYKNDRNTNFKLQYNGLDRLDSSLGYTDKNTVPACKKCNIAKGEMSISEFKEFLTRIHKWNFKGDI